MFETLSSGIAASPVTIRAADEEGMAS